MGRPSSRTDMNTILKIGSQKTVRNHFRRVLFPSKLKGHNRLTNRVHRRRRFSGCPVGRGDKAPASCQEACQAIEREESLEILSAQVLDLLGRKLRHDPEMVPTMAEARRHWWVLAASRLTNTELVRSMYVPRNQVVALALRLSRLAFTQFARWTTTTGSVSEKWFERVLMRVVLINVAAGAGAFCATASEPVLDVCARTIVWASVLDCTGLLMKKRLKWSASF